MASRGGIYGGGVKPETTGAPILIGAFFKGREVIKGDSKIGPAFSCPELWMYATQKVPVA